MGVVCKKWAERKENKLAWSQDGVHKQSAREKGKKKLAWSRATTWLHKQR